MTQTLQSLFQSLVGSITQPAIVTDVAFPLPGGLRGAADAFAGQIEADIYARPHNPTVKALTDVIARLDGGTGAVAYSSGQAAVRNVLQILTRQDTEVILSRHVFGGTTALGGGLLERYGVTFKWADATDPPSFEALITDKTRVFFTEGVANPGGDVAEFKGLRAVADKYNLPLIVDNTTAPLLLRPAEHGADIIVYSATKYLNGQGDALAGIAVDTGRFNWKDDARYPVLSASAGGVPSLAERFGDKALFKGLQSQLTVDGAVLAPEKAATILKNIVTLPQRLEAHIANTAAVAKLLQAHPAVEAVHYAGLSSDASHERANTYLPHGVAGTLLVTLHGGREAAGNFIDRVSEAFVHAVNIGDARLNLVSHPATTTHRQLSEAQRESIGIKEGSLRLSISATEVAPTLKTLERALNLGL